MRRRSEINQASETLRRGPGAVIGTAGGKVRDAIAGGLVALGVTPNTLTVAGFVLTCVAVPLLVFGAGHAAPWEARWAPTPSGWSPLVAALILTLAGALDMLDGAVARLGRTASRFGAVLDSTLDRFGDAAIFAGGAIYFALVGNVTYVALSLLALTGAFSISYVKARGENLIEDCGVGFWQRGERYTTFMVGAYLGHIPAALWVLGTLPWFTVLRRLRHVHRLSAGGRPWEPSAWQRTLMPWTHPRGSAGYDLCVGVVVAFLVAAPWLLPFFYGGTDPLRTLLERVAGL